MDGRANSVPPPGLRWEDSREPAPDRGSLGGEASKWTRGVEGGAWGGSGQVIDEAKVCMYKYVVQYVPSAVPWQVTVCFFPPPLGRRGRVSDLVMTWRRPSRTSGRDVIPVLKRLEANAGAERSSQEIKWPVQPRVAAARQRPEEAGVATQAIAVGERRWENKSGFPLDASRVYPKRGTVPDGYG